MRKSQTMIYEAHDNVYIIRPRENDEDCVQPKKLSTRDRFVGVALRRKKK